MEGSKKYHFMRNWCGKLIPVPDDAIIGFTKIVYGEEKTFKSEAEMHNDVVGLPSIAISKKES